jgi:hypothetical protein
LCWISASPTAADVVVRARQLGAALADLGLELVAHEQDPGDGLLQLVVAAHALGDGVLVDRARILLLALAHPLHRATAHQPRQAGEDSGSLRHARLLAGSA